MTSVFDHYDSLLAPVYLWMAGGLDVALEQGAADVAAFLDAPGRAIDLGAGFGMHSIPLARAGFDVVAIDTSSYLLEQLRGHRAGLRVKTVQADLRDFARHVAAPADLIICMGDTLAHLQSADEIRQLFRDVALALRPGGRFQATFRDYRELPLGDQRFIPVRSDAQRIHTCFLEEAGNHVVVHDIVHERGGEGWAQRVSSYRKLRLSSEFVTQAAEDAGLRCRCGPGPRRMLMLEAQFE